MEMMNIIGQISDLDLVSMNIVKSGCVQVVNALNEINENDFTIMTPNQDTNILTDLCFIRPYTNYTDCSKLKEQIIELMDIFGIGQGVSRKYLESSFDIKSIMQGIDQVYKEVKEYQGALDSLNLEIQKNETFLADIEKIRDMRISLNELKAMNYFEFRIGRMSKENYDKLIDNIENISSIIYELRSAPGYCIFMSLTPKMLSSEVERILKSLNWEEISIPYELEGTPGIIIEKLQEKISEKRKEAKELEIKVQELKGKYGAYVDECYSKLRMYERIQSINSEVAYTNEFFYMAGWVPDSRKKDMQKLLSEFGDRLIIVFKPQRDVTMNIAPPTKLSNNWLVRPFESIVRMYGTPSYNEIDPTWFVAITYMFMFGYMFGDLGQGAIFLAAGIILSKWFRRPNLGGILSRIGASSMVFGVLFGSVFGNEEIIKHPLVRPMDNINAVLLGGVAVGIIFTTAGFILNLINTAKRGDIEEGVFGKNGLVGLTFYWLIIITALSVASNGSMPLPMSSIVIILCLLLLLMVLKQPLANIIKGKKPIYNESIGDYYVESGFGVLETMISMLSNTVSFIRVGAFALNHVGLFVAFATVAKMVREGAGSTAVLIIGNIVIICLEGLVVFIQGLRLEYYELFSKYYKGDGEEYSPVMLRYSDRQHDIKRTVAKIQPRPLNA